MKIKHWQLFKDSLFHPKKLAAYRLLPIGKVIQYVLLLVTFVSIISFIQFLAGVGGETSQIKGLQEYLNDIKWLIYPFSFVLLFIINSFSVFVQISIYAIVGLGILKFLKKRGEYRHIWRTASFAITLSIIFTTVSIFFQVNNRIISSIGIIITAIYLVQACRKYPNQPQK
ncbi:DUF1189 family protein [Rummeliibacillus pycnus]|uniref:DUF1189 family protein n=1 Tax=Rummeliibacillus pycnus TaxID=101070 RepID=UPI003D2CE5AA